MSYLRNQFPILYLNSTQRTIYYKIRVLYEELTGLFIPQDDERETIGKWIVRKILCDNTEHRASVH